MNRIKFYLFLLIALAAQIFRLAIAPIRQPFYRMAVKWAGIILLMMAGTAGLALAQQVEPTGGGEFRFLPKDELTEQQRAEIQQQLQASIQRLEEEGKF